MKKPPHQLLLSLSFSLSLFLLLRGRLFGLNEKNFRKELNKKKERRNDSWISNINILKNKPSILLFFHSLITVSKISKRKRKNPFITPKTKLLHNYPRNSIVILPFHFQELSAKWNHVLIRCNDVTAFTIHARRTRGIYLENAR